ncbi:hypothetical protein NT6N_01870 [Oceaniferula spumae]|uniref:Uncharacterized protein n=1 Tax=Oceaniferula spumae TaxID=2979115 RepID=A0AAT9FGM7_9BACT
MKLSLVLDENAVRVLDKSSQISGGGNLHFSTAEAGVGNPVSPTNLPLRNQGLFFALVSEASGGDQ